MRKRGEREAMEKGMTKQGVCRKNTEGFKHTIICLTW